MKSMTGFAKIQNQINNSVYTIEIKTLNSKQIDAIVKLPASFRSKELEIRSMLNQLERGKIEFSLSEELDKTNMSSINHEVAKTFFADLKQLAIELGQPTDNLMDMVIRRPDVWENVQTEELREETWESVAKLVQSAISALDETRLHEGEILKQDFIKHINIIQDKLNAVPPFEAERIENLKERLRKNLAELEITVDENRFEQELIYYLEKLDITEEKVRLQKHIDYFIETMNLDESTGKKLGFISQEMGREINTMGSKANHTEIQKLVVVMKDELEKIKEQLGNIL